jgi:hypothetical protein
MAAPLHVVLDLRGQGAEIALAGITDTEDEPMPASIAVGT